VNWEAIMREAEKLERMLRQADLDLNEAEKAIGYYLFKGCDEQAMDRYLRQMAENPPPRSKRTQRYYQQLYRIWRGWSSTCQLTGIDKARAWGWGVRMRRAEV